MTILQKLIALAIIISVSGCKKLEKYEGNNVSFEPTVFELEETISLTVPNSAFDFSGFLNCPRPSIRTYPGF